MYTELWRLMVNQNITLVTLWVVFVALGVVLVYWLYAEVIIYKRRKIVEIEKVRDKMDGIELGIRRNSKRSGRNSLVIDLSTLDRSPAAIDATTSKLGRIAVANMTGFTATQSDVAAVPTRQYTPIIKQNIIEEDEEYYAQAEDEENQFVAVADIESSGDSGEHTQEDEETSEHMSNQTDQLTPNEDYDSEIEQLAETVMLRHPRL